MSLQVQGKTFIVFLLPLFPCPVLKKEEEEKKARVGTGRKITIGN